jgi:hypothetical protein
MLGGTSGWCSGRGGGQQLGQELGEQRVLFAHGLVGNDGDLAIARGSDEGDDTATLEKAEDARARATHEGLDFVLRGRGCWVKHLAFAVAVWGVNTVQENCV